MIKKAKFQALYATVNWVISSNPKKMVILYRDLKEAMKTNDNEWAIRIIDDADNIKEKLIRSRYKKKSPVDFDYNIYKLDFRNELMKQAIYKEDKEQVNFIIDDIGNVRLHKDMIEVCVVKNNISLLKTIIESPYLVNPIYKGNKEAIEKNINCSSAVVLAVENKNKEMVEYIVNLARHCNYLKAMNTSAKLNNLEILKCLLETKNLKFHTPEYEVLLKHSIDNENKEMTNYITSRLNAKKTKKIKKW